jgi:hypothetical protein
MAKNTTIVRITSGGTYLFINNQMAKFGFADRNEYTEMVHRAPWIVYQALLLATALCVLVYGIWKLITYIQFFGPQFSIAQTCLGLQITGSCGT